MRLHQIRHIDRPIAEVFSFTADFANAETWDPGVASSRRVGEGPPDVGTRYELVVEFGSSQIPMTYEITEWAPQTRVVLEGSGESVAATDEIIFDARDGGTRVEYTADLRFTNWLRFVAPLLAPVMHRVGKRALDGLVAELER